MDSITILPQIVLHLFILQPTRLVSKILIDNIFLNTIKYPSHSGNLTIQLSDHLFQFVILEEFYKDLVQRKINLYHRNFKIFDEDKFKEALKELDRKEILS